MPRIAIVAHNMMKPKLVSFLKEREDWLWGRELVATGLTADFLEKEELKVPVEHLKAGKEGGYRQLTDLVKQDEISLALFFRDPEIVQDYEKEVSDFVRECNRQNVPLATNPASAELLILGLIRKESSEKQRGR